MPEKIKIENKEPAKPLGYVRFIDGTLSPFYQLEELKRIQEENPGRVVEIIERKEK